MDVKSMHCTLSKKKFYDKTYNFRGPHFQKRKKKKKQQKHARKKFQLKTPN